MKIPTFLSAKGMFYKLSSLDYRCSFDWVRTRFDGGNLTHEFLRCINESARELNLPHTQIVSWHARNSHALVLNIMHARGFNTPQEAATFVDSVFEQLSPLVNAKWQAHSDRRHHEIEFPGKADPTNLFPSLMPRLIAA